MATRMMITLDAEQHRRARQKAAANGVSLAEYIRRLLALDLEEERTPAEVTSVFALFHSGGSDVATHKDTYVSQAAQTQHPRRGTSYA
jgi:hypothetical protein